MVNDNNSKQQFHEALAFLIESANINSGILTMEEIKSALDDIITDDSMYQLVYDYLLENKISIKGYIQHKKPRTDENEEATKAPEISEINVPTEQADEKEKNIVQMYLEEIDNSLKLSAEEELQMLISLLSNQTNFAEKENGKKSPSDKRKLINLLAENNLHLVVSISNQFQGKGVSHGDLLQEGNLGLIEGIATYTDKADLTLFHKFLEDCITSAMKDAILEQDASSRIGLHAADRANELDRASVALSKELNRTPSMEELAKYVSLPVDEVQEIMKMSLNALNADNAE